MELQLAEATPIAPGGETGTGTLVETAAEHKVFPPFDPTTFASQLLWFAITFAILYFLMSKVAIPRIAAILTERTGRIAADIEKAERAKSDSEAALAAYEKALAAARSNASAIAETSRTAAKAASDAERQGTEGALASKLAAAEVRIGEIKTRALADVGAIASEATAAIVKALIDADIGKSDADAAVATAMGK
jgi:F-type H+-transporting ATPase subunit b